MPTNFEAAISLLIQVPLLGIFIWYSVYMWKLSAAAQEKFMSALDKRDEEFEKRNDKVCANLENLAEAIGRLDTNINARMDRVQNSRKGD